MPATSMAGPPRDSIQQMAISKRLSHHLQPPKWHISRSCNWKEGQELWPRRCETGYECAQQRLRCSTMHLPQPWFFLGCSKNQGILCPLTFSWWLRGIIWPPAAYCSEYIVVITTYHWINSRNRSKIAVTLIRSPIAYYIWLDITST